MTLKSQRLNKILFFVCHTPVCVCGGGGESGSSGIRSRGDAGSFPPVAPPSSRSSELSPFGRQTKKKDAHTQERFWGKRTVLKAACVSDFCPPAIAWVTWPRDCEGDQAYSSRMPKRWTNTHSLDYPFDYLTHTCEVGTTINPTLKARTHSAVAQFRSMCYTNEESWQVICFKQKGPTCI